MGSGVEVRTGCGGVDTKVTSLPGGGNNKEELSDMTATFGSLQVEHCEEEKPGGDLEQWWDACEEDKMDDSTVRGSSRDDGIQSHVSRCENLEKLNISRTLSSVEISSFSSAVWKMQDVWES